MTLITQEDEPSSLKTALETLEKQIRRLSLMLAALQDEIDAGQHESLNASSKLIPEIRQWLKIGMELEIKHDDEIRQKRGIANSYALDFDEARSSIGCRLDRLRTARCSGGVFKRAR